MDESQPFDAEFRAALRYFLQQRGWTNQEFCERTRPGPGLPRRIVPSSVSDWCKRSHPSNRAIMIVCKTLGVPRSYFFEAGERLIRVEREMEQQRPSWPSAGELLEPRRRRIAEEPGAETTAEAVDKMSSAALETLAKLEAAIRERRAELEDLRTDAERLSLQSA